MLVDFCLHVGSDSYSMLVFLYPTIQQTSLSKSIPATQRMVVIVQSGISPAYCMQVLNKQSVASRAHRNMFSSNWLRLLLGFGTIRTDSESHVGASVQCRVVQSSGCREQQARLIVTSSWGVGSQDCILDGSGLPRQSYLHLVSRHSSHISQVYGEEFPSTSPKGV